MQITYDVNQHDIIVFHYCQMVKHSNVKRLVYLITRYVNISVIVEVHMNKNIQSRESILSFIKRISYLKIEHARSTLFCSNPG